MTKRLDRVLDHITMYRLVLYYLAVLVAAALFFSVLGVLPFHPAALAFSAGLILAACGLANWIFARVFGVPANVESVYITGLILVLILEPVSLTDASGAGGLVMASTWAVASKFILTLRRKHVFNPAALAVVLTGFLLDQPATWWIGGSLALLPLVLCGGFLIVRKIRRSDTVLTFLAVALVAILATTDPSQYGKALSETLLSSPLLFFAFVMLTEPLTAPTTRWPRLAFGALVGFLSAPNVHIGAFYFTPELALLTGNLFAFAVSPKGRFVLTLERIEQSAAGTLDFIFRSPRKLAFEAGQYLEWTLGLPRADSRGNRRFFTVASAPTEDTIRLGVKFYPAASAFKRALKEMAPGDTIHAAQIAGDFTLPADPEAKLAFLAGGIGITPFRSMLQYLRERNEARPIVILYGNERQEDIAYRDILEAAKSELGIRTIHAVARRAAAGQYPGFIDARLVRAAIPDFRERIFYISGPQVMVKALRAMLLGLGVQRSRIKVDFFPGFA